MRRHIFVAAIAIAAMPTAGDAAQYFVSTTGNNAWPGTSAQPWRTLQYAADRVGAGDHVTVRQGNYAGFHLDANGTAAAPIQFLAQPGVLINAPNPIRAEHGINLENASHVIIDGFAVTGMQRAGVRTVGVDGDTFASHVTIRNVRSYNNGYWGILTGFVHDLVVENNETSGSTFEHGIYVSNSGDRPIIRNNYSWGNDRNGIHINGDAEIGGDGIITGALVSGNIIHGNGVDGGSGINMDGVQNSRIENNLIYDNHASGISLYRIDGGGPSSGNVVVNNTIYQAADARWALNIQDASTNNKVRNNVLISQSGSRGAIDISQNSLSGFTSDYNVVISRFTTNGGSSNQTLAQWRASTGQDAHSLLATAAQLFANPASDFHLLTTSPAIDAGTATFAPSIDLDGRTRPVGAAFDIGAYEMGLSGDHNGDGRVDLEDYVSWRVSDNSTAGYTAWRTNFGDTNSSATASATSVPEPATLMLLCISCLSAHQCGRNARRLFKPHDA